MSAKEILLIDLQDALFIEAVKQKLLEEYGVVQVGNLQALTNRFSNEKDSFAFVRFSDKKPVAFAVGKKLALTDSAYFTEYFGYIKDLWSSHHCEDVSCRAELLSLCEKEFINMGITQFATDSETSNDLLFLESGYAKNESFLHNGIPVLSKV